MGTPAQAARLNANKVHPSVADSVASGGSAEVRASPQLNPASTDEAEVDSVSSSTRQQAGSGSSSGPPPGGVDTTHVAAGRRPRKSDRCPARAVRQRQSGCGRRQRGATGAAGHNHVAASGSPSQLSCRPFTRVGPAATRTRRDNYGSIVRVLVSWLSEGN